MKTMLNDKQKAQAPVPVKAVEQSCVTCGGARSYRNSPATDGNAYRDNIQERELLLRNIRAEMVLPREVNPLVTGARCQLVHVMFEISLWRGVRVGVRTYLLGGAIDGSEANGIIHDPNIPKELVGFTPSRRMGFRMEFVQGATPIYEGSCRLTSLERQEVWNDCRSCKVRVGSNGNLLWEASVLLGRKKGGVRVAREDDRGVTKGREDVREVFQQRGSGAKRKLSRCGRNQMGNEPILALPEGADDFVVYYDARSKDLKACLEKGRRIEHEAKMLYRGVGRRSEAKNEFEIDVRRSDLESGSYWLDKVRTSIWRDVRTLAIEEAYTTKYSIHPGADTMLCGFRLTNRWLSMKKDIASCGSKYLAYLEVEVEYQGSSGLLLQPELPE
ncbi:hypothetical protein Tco_0743614, partial [Tanacetum coccineum]